MTTRYPGGLIRKTPPTITPPVDGEGGSAPGVWTLEQASYYTKQGTWPLPIKQGALYVWGSNSQGDLGQNNTIFRSSPVQVGADTNWNVIVSGRQSCKFGIKTNGTLWAWGNNEDGQLGLNSPVSLDRSSPVQVGALTNWSKISCGDVFSVAIKTDGTLWSWGSNGQGRLGQNIAFNVFRSSPVQIGAETNWYGVACGKETAYAIKTDGTLWAWGNSVHGGLGNDTNTGNRSSPVQIGALTNWANVFSCGDYFGLAIKTDGTLWTWGYNGFGNLGQGNLVYRSSPTQVGALTNWSKAGINESHVLVIKTDGTLWAWGKNNTGQLGTNDAVYRSSPVQVGSLSNWSRIGCGRDQAFAIKTDGTLWSWGSNGAGILGQNVDFTTAKSSPTQVGSLTNWIRIDPTASGSCGAISTP